jgi:hypothetical protein
MPPTEIPIPVLEIDKCYFRTSKPPRYAGAASMFKIWGLYLKMARPIPAFLAAAIHTTASICGPRGLWVPRLAYG